jgi:hypothetical protein
LTNPTGTISRHQPSRAVAAKPGASWWTEVADVRDRIERRRAIERVTRQRGGLPPRRAAARRTVTITGKASPAHALPDRLAQAEAQAHAQAVAGAARRRPQRSTSEWLGSSPDRLAAWAVALGFLLVVAALLSAH